MRTLESNQRSGLFFLACLGALTALPLQAQNKTVVPAGNATVEGNSFDGRPFGMERIRATQLIPLADLRIARGRQITEIAYRRDGEVLRTSSLTRTRAGAWSIRMGNINTGIASGVPFNPAAPTGIYLRPGNGTNSLIEYYNAVPVWPALVPKVGSTPDFVLRFKLRSPFVVQGPNAIAVDHYLYGSNGRQYAYFIDAQRSNNDSGKAANYGASCPTDDVHNRSFAIPSNPGGRPAEFGMFGAVPSAPAILALGGSKTNWLSFQLPLALDSLGLKGCSIYASQDILIPTTTFTTGAVRLQAVLPRDPNLRGITVFAQWTVIDSQLSQTLPLTFSNGTEVTLGTTLGETGLGTSLIYGVTQSSVVRGRYGLVDKGHSFVTEFTHN